VKNVSFLLVFLLWNLYNKRSLFMLVCLKLSQYSKRYTLDIQMIVKSPLLINMFTLFS
jgi:hypothetical protein